MVIRKKPEKHSAPALKIVDSSTETGSQPPRKLGAHGLNLWRAITSEYDISDIGGIEILAQICAALDRAEALAEQVEADGPKGGLKEHPALKTELANRAFVCRNIQRLGLNLEVVKPVGRPNRSSGWAPS